MAHIIHSINCTFNGCCHHEQVIANEEHHSYAEELLVSSEALLLGRGTFDLFAGFWPSVTKSDTAPSHVVRFAKQLEAKKKFIATSSPLNTTWANCARLSQPLKTEVSALRASTAGTILVFGSPKLGEALLGLNEVDELHVLIQPIAAGGKPRLFDRLSTATRFSLLEVSTFKSGVLLVRYGRRADLIASGDV